MSYKQFLSWIYKVKSPKYIFSSGCVTWESQRTNMRFGIEKKSQKKPSHILRRLGLDGERSPTGLSIWVWINHICFLNGAQFITSASSNPSLSTHNFVSYVLKYWHCLNFHTLKVHPHLHSIHLLLLPSYYKERHTSSSINESPTCPPIPNHICLLRG